MSGNEANCSIGSGNEATCSIGSGNEANCSIGSGNEASCSIGSWNEANCSIGSGNETRFSLEPAKCLLKFLCALMELGKCSVVPRPFPAPFFDRLQCANTDCKRVKTGAGEGSKTKLHFTQPTDLPFRVWF